MKIQIFCAAYQREFTLEMTPAPNWALYFPLRLAADPGPRPDQSRRVARASGPCEPLTPINKLATKRNGAAAAASEAIH